MNRRIVAVILALAVVTGPACSSGKDSTAERSTTTTTSAGSDASAGAIDSTTAPPPPGDGTEAVKSAYLHFWTVVDEYGKRTGRFDPVDARAVLGAVATGGEYDHLFNMFQLNRIKGLVYRDGDAPDEYAPVVTIESPTRASVKDCRTDNGGVYKESGERVDTPTVGRRLFEVILVKEDSQWKVSSVGGRARAEDPPCTV